jgi:chloride channel 2
MYGRYTKDLGEYAKEEARKAKALERKRKKEDRLRNKELQNYRGKCASKLIAAFSFVWRHTFARLGEDWVFLALLGIIMAFISFFMDHGISLCNQGTVRLFSRYLRAAHNQVIV